jgi:hypothetical protein
MMRTMRSTMLIVVMALEFFESGDTVESVQITELITDGEVNNSLA